MVPLWGFVRKKTYRSLQFGLGIRDTGDRFGLHVTVPIGHVLGNWFREAKKDVFF